MLDTISKGWLEGSQRRHHGCRLVFPANHDHGSPRRERDIGWPRRAVTLLLRDGRQADGRKRARKKDDRRTGPEALVSKFAEAKEGSRELATGRHEARKWPKRGESSELRQMSARARLHARTLLATGATILPLSHEASDFRGETRKRRGERIARTIR